MPRLPVDTIVQTNPIITSHIGYNIPWLIFDTGAETDHDGYGNGFDNAYFNGTGANTNLQYQIDVLRNNNVKYIRLWLNIYHYMNADKDTVGYTSFRDGFLTNLATYCDWCDARGIKMLICLDDGWYTFPWTWVNDAPKKASYIQACSDVVTALKDKPAVWGWDYCNEPYMGWSWSVVDSTTHTHQQDSVYGPHDIGYDRTYLTNFFKELYGQLKAIATTHLFSVGSTTPPYQDSYDLSRWDIKNAVDFYQVHYYATNPSTIRYSASEFDKPVIVGEYGHSGDAVGYTSNTDVMMRFTKILLNKGFLMVMPWSSNSSRTRNGVNNYAMNSMLSVLNSF